jgi:acetyl esterase/lipase
MTRRYWSGFLAALLAACSQMPPEIAEQVKAIGPVIDPPKTAAIYAPLQQKEPHQGVKVTRDIKYGPDPLQALDLFVPEAGGTVRPVLIFVRGGAFFTGNKRAPGSPFYDNVMLAAAGEGIIGVNLNYRLAPKHMWPAGAVDVGEAVRWVQRNIASHGGDPKRVFLMGHSAGAVHTASYIAFPEHHKAGGIGLAGQSSSRACTTRRRASPASRSWTISAARRERAKCRPCQGLSPRRSHCWSCGRSSIRSLLPIPTRRSC